MIAVRWSTGSAHIQYGVQRFMGSLPSHPMTEFLLLLFFFSPACKSLIKVTSLMSHLPPSAGCSGSMLIHCGVR